MSFITYSQNFEDVLLWRALGHIRNGFYIDVGANDPVEHSVTKAFYDAGWCGINIEPLPSFHQAFLDQRPRDINLAVAAGATESEIKLFDVPTVNGWASSDATVAAAHRAEGFDVVELIVPMRSLAAICREHVRGDVHFLKIDVEGFEGEVLRGMDFSAWRPWVLVIEATLPNSPVTNHETWEGMVTSCDYHFAYFDGLNRYYVANEHRDLLSSLAVQPNVFDNFISAHLVRAAEVARIQQEAAAAAGLQMESLQLALIDSQEDGELLRDRVQDGEGALASAQRLLAELSVYASKLEKDLQATNARAQDLEAQIFHMQDSPSWRLTKPLRKIDELGLCVYLKAILRDNLRRGVRWLVARESLRRLILPRLARLPWLDAKVTRLLGRIKSVPQVVHAQARQAEVAPHLVNLPASARQVFADLSRGNPPSPP